MNKTGNILALCGLLLLLLLWAGCKKGDDRQPCAQPQTVTLRAHCYKIVDTVVSDSVLNYPVLIPVNPQTPVRYTTSSRTSILSMYLSSLSDTCRWIVQPDSANTNIRDTLTFVYSRRLQFISNTCGYTYYYSLKNVFTRPNSPVIDSVNILVPEVTNDANVQHVRLYF